MVKTSVSEACVTCERLVGTMGGGMDQTVICHAKETFALYVSFNPTTVEPIGLPHSVALLTVNSCVVAEKSAGAKEAFNTRVIECRLAAALLLMSLLAKKGSKTPFAWQGTTALTLGVVESNLRLDTQEGGSVRSLEEALDLVYETLHEDAYSINECLALLGLDHDIDSLVDRLFRDIKHASLLLKSANPDEPFLYLRERAIHVYSEASRVLRFRQHLDCIH